MDISNFNENGMLEAGHREEVARHGRAFAGVDFALCDDGAYRYSIDVMYSYGGFCGPISVEGPSFATLASARDAALEELLRRFPTAWESEPQSVHDELRILREQVEAQLRQPSLF
jgi:hypothetical protein